MELLTKKDVVEALPAQMKVSVSQDMVDELNALSDDPIVAETMRDNFISHTRVLSEGKFKLKDYVSAVIYVSFKLMGYTSREAYTRTFPGRYKELVKKGTSDKDISSYVAGYNKNKLVNLIQDQSLIPIWVLNQDVYQKAINVQADLMQHAQSEKVRSDAANSLLTHLKKPESKQIELNINHTDNSGMNELRDKLREFAEMQQDLIQGGMSTKTIAHQKLVNPDIEDAEVIE